MERISINKAKDQAARIKLHFETICREEAPQIQLKAGRLTSPLSFRDSSHIYRWLSRKQITFENLSEVVLEEFKSSKQFNNLVARGLV